MSILNNFFNVQEIIYSRPSYSNKKCCTLIVFVWYIPRSDQRTEKLVLQLQSHGKREIAHM